MLLIDMIYLLYFVCGIIQDFLFTLSIRFVSEKKAFAAGSMSFLETVVTMLVIYDILNRLEASKSIWAILVYALGIGFGTIFAVRFKNHK